MRMYDVIANSPSTGNTAEHRRVGPFKDRSEAERAATAMVSDGRGWQNIHIRDLDQRGR